MANTFNSLILFASKLLNTLSISNDFDEFEKRSRQNFLESMIIPIIFFIVIVVINIVVVIGFVKSRKKSSEIADKVKEKMQEKIEHEKTKDVCPYCGNRLGEKENKCPSCGARRK